MNVGFVIGIILTVLVIGLLIPIGIKQIGGLKEYTDTTLYSKVYEDLKYNVERIYRMQEGSSIVFELNIPEGYSFCFVNPTTINIGDTTYQSFKKNYINPNNPRHNWIYRNSLYKSVLDENIMALEVNGEIKHKSNNVIVFKNEMPETFLRLENVIMQTNFCVEGRDKLRLENKGTYVVLSVID